MVVVGYNRSKQYVVIDDPAGERYCILIDDFNEMWASGFNFLMLVAAEEKGDDLK